MPSVGPDLTGPQPRLAPVRRADAPRVRHRRRRRRPLDPALVPGAGGIAAWLAQREADFPDILPGCEKRVLWAGAPGERSEMALVYLHGFSASGAELSPVTERLAERFGANLFLTRLAGHGRSPAAMAEPRARDWLDDLHEAVAVGGAIGRKVWLIGNSTGGSLAALAAADPGLAARLAGVVLISPNFGLGRPDWQRVNWPLARHWLRLALGGEIGFLPCSEDHARFWTHRYPPSALVPMGAVARRAARADLRRAQLPALILYSPEDCVVSIPEIRRVAGEWGSASGLKPTVIERHLAEGDDPACHILGGDILSPGQTADLAQAIGDWLARQ